MYRLLLFIKFGKFSAIISSNIFFCLSPLLWHSHYTHFGTPNDISHFYEVVCFSIFFLFLRLDNFKWPIFKLTNSLVSSNLLLKPYSEFFILITVLFNSWISIWLLQFLFSPYFMKHCHTLRMVFFSSLIILMTTLLNLTSCHFHRHCMLFPLCMGQFPVYFISPKYFLLKMRFLIIHCSNSSTGSSPPPSWLVLLFSGWLDYFSKSISAPLFPTSHSV